MLKKEIIVVGIVIACIAVGGLAYYLLTRDEGMPLYPGGTKSLLTFEELTGESPPAGFDNTLYRVDASVDNIISWYRTEMDKRGWTKTRDEPYKYPVSHILGYTKNDKAAGILAIDWAGQPFLVLMRG